MNLLADTNRDLISVGEIPEEASEVRCKGNLIRAETYPRQEYSSWDLPLLPEAWEEQSGHSETLDHLKYGS